MKYFVTAKFLQIFFILAFITAQISPACAFVSGKTTEMQICASDGSYQTVKVSDQYDVSAWVKKDSEKPEQNQKHQKLSECGFCFAQSHLTKNIPSLVTIDFLPVSETHIFIGAGSIVYKAFDSVSFNPRAPPFHFA